MRKMILVAMALMLGAGMANAAPTSPATDASVNEHSGGTNSAGCHNDTKRGTYHCH